jgi:hypothetical protein
MADHESAHQQHLDTTTPTGKLLFQVTGAFFRIRAQHDPAVVNAGLSAIIGEVRHRRRHAQALDSNVVIRR